MNLPAHRGAITPSLDLDLFRNFVIALLIGALVGVEREKKKARDGETGTGTSGLRTFILVAQLGAVAAWISTLLGSPLPFVAGLLAVAAQVAVGYVVQSRIKPGSIGLTTEAAVVAVYLLGGACLLDHAAVAVMLGVVTSATLAYKQPLHGMVDKLGPDDIHAGLKLLIATFVVLPLLPNRTIDPWDALNPYELWWLVILISSLSLVGYVAVRMLGEERGAAVTGATGGLVSSTAVTLAFSRRSRERPGTEDALGVGLLLAWGVMFARVVVEVAVVHAALLAELLVPMLSMGLAALLFAALLHGRLAKGGVAQAAPQSVPLRNPFSLTAACHFALFFAAVLLVVKLAQHYLPGSGVYAIAALAGLTDVDAITLSMAREARAGGAPAEAVTAIVIAALANTLTKAAMVGMLASPGLRRRVLGATGLILLAGGLALALG